MVFHVEHGNDEANIGLAYATSLGTVSSLVRSIVNDFRANSLYSIEITFGCAIRGMLAKRTVRALHESHRIEE